MRLETDFLIIGSGIAGLSLALKLADLGRVIVATKKGKSDTATRLAQGGIACVSSSDDSFELHIQDTLRSGDGICHEETVELVVKEARDRIAGLENLGVHFERNHDGSYSLHQEGGHSRRRIVHCKDYTGLEIQNVLTERAMENPNIEILEDYIAVDLITESKIQGLQGDTTRLKQDRCIGCYLLDVTTGTIYTVLAGFTVLATGGAGKVYLYTSNPDVATGDGIAIAYRAGARIANVEFVQFHPTCLFHPRAKNFLISEALRGDGARLLNVKGERFMERYCPETMELSGRDVVARAIDSELKRTGDDCVFLDITHKPREFIEERFPNIYSTCLKLGIDITTEPIPVVPAAHYMCGGVVTDRFGRTDIACLYAAGETACTGLHGANRLASNSLLEGLVMAEQIFRHIQQIGSLKPSRSLLSGVPDWDTRGAVDLKEGVLISHNWDGIRRLMWNYVGIVRNEKRLMLARKRLRPILEEIEQHYWEYILTRDFVELRNLAQVAELIIEAASMRKESRGGHYNEDFPSKDDWNWRRDTVLQRLKAG